MCEEYTSAISNISPRFRDSLIHVPNALKKTAQELCMRVNHPLTIFTPEKSFSISDVVSQADLFETMKILCNFSVYSFQNEIKNGFITLKGGHRAGLCGTAIFHDNEVINVSDISSINLRISREIKGSSDEIFKKFGLDIGGTLIVGPPSSGKTTILRDIARRISSTMKNGRLIKTTIVDERREIAAVYKGVPQKDIGFCDVLNGFSKADGILRAIRTLSPQIVICDEIGSNEDSEAIKKTLNCGVEIISSVHAKSLDEISRSQKIKNLLNSGAIRHVVLLNSPGVIKNIFDVEGSFS